MKVDTTTATTNINNQHPHPEQQVVVLVQAGKQLERQDKQQQSKFLTTAMRHYQLLEQTKDDDNSKKNDSINNIIIHPKHCLGNTTAVGDGDLVGTIRNSISLTKLKQWKHVASPCVLIICLSARRAVAILKDLRVLQLRVAKLFPKNGSIQDQNQMLLQPSKKPISLAVGTPHRLLQLEALRTLSHTQLVLLDGHLNQKQYTVCTLPDTAPHCMEFLATRVLPQLRQRKDIKIGFVGGG